MPIVPTGRRACLRRGERRKCLPIRSHLINTQPDDPPRRRLVASGSLELMLDDDARQWSDDGRGAVTARLWVVGLTARGHHRLRAESRSPAWSVPRHARLPERRARLVRLCRVRPPRGGVAESPSPSRGRTCSPAGYPARAGTTRARRAGSPRCSSRATPNLTVLEAELKRDGIR